MTYGRTASKVLTRGLAFALLPLAAAVAADSGWQKPCNPPFPCVPNAKNYGYFETRWRSWPGEYRPEKDFSAGVGREIIPAPPGDKSVPPPKATVLPPKPMPGGEGTFPGELPNLPERGGLMPDIPGPAPSSPILPPSPLDLLNPPSSPAVPEPREPAPTPQPAPGLPETQPEKPDTESDAATPKGPSAKGSKLEGDEPPIPDEPQAPARPKPSASRLRMDRGLHSSKPASAAPQSGQRAAKPLQAAWASALYPESMASGELRTVSHIEVQPAPAPRVALDGYCPVDLCEHESWTQGSARYKAVHEGATYLFSGAAQQKRFLASPARYAPACSGNDPVLNVEEKSQTPGRTEHSAIYHGRLYLFSSAATLARFREQPQRYDGKQK